jgi:hypothetical protein
MIVLRMGVLALAFKCLRFSGLACFRLSGCGALRIVECVAFCCVIQVISLSSAAGAADALKTRKNGGFSARTPSNQFKRRCDRGQMGEEQTLPLIPLMTLIYTDMKEPDFTHRKTSRVIGEAKAHRGDAEARRTARTQMVTTDKQCDH